MAVGCFTLAMAMQAFSQAGYLANMQDIAPRYAGRLFGLANTAGSLAGVIGTAAVGIIVERTGSWTPVFQTMVRFTGWGDVDVGCGQHCRVAGWRRQTEWGLGCSR